MLALPSGSWLTGFLPAVSVIAAGTGISWAIAGADYSRYQSPSSSSKSIFAAVMGGACLPLMLLMLAGILLSVQLPDLASRQPHRADRLSAARTDGDPLSAGRHRRHRHHRGAQPVFRQP